MLLSYLSRPAPPPPRDVSAIRSKDSSAVSRLPVKLAMCMSATAALARRATTVLATPARSATSSSAEVLF